MREAEPSNDTALKRFAPAHRAMKVPDPEAANRPIGGLVIVTLEAQRQSRRYVPGMLTPLAPAGEIRIALLLLQRNQLRDVFRNHTDSL